MAEQNQVPNEEFENLKKQLAEKDQELRSFYAQNPIKSKVISEEDLKKYSTNELKLMSQTVEKMSGKTNDMVLVDRHKDSKEPKKQTMSQGIFNYETNKMEYR